MVSSSLKGHRRGIMAEVCRRQGSCKWGGGGVIYVVSFPCVLKTVKYLVTGCPEVAHSTGRLRKLFVYRHFFSRIAVVQ